MLHDLYGLLMRFRLEKVGMVADTDKAFAQPGLQQSDRDPLRFIWLKNLKLPNVSKQI